MAISVNTFIQSDNYKLIEELINLPEDQFNALFENRKIRGRFGLVLKDKHDQYSGYKAVPSFGLFKKSLARIRILKEDDESLDHFLTSQTNENINNFIKLDINLINNQLLQPDFPEDFAEEMQGALKSKLAIDYMRYILETMQLEDRLNKRIFIEGSDEAYFSFYLSVIAEETGIAFTDDPEKFLEEFELLAEQDVKLTEYGDGLFEDWAVAHVKLDKCLSKHVKLPQKFPALKDEHGIDTEKSKYAKLILDAIKNNIDLDLVSPAIHAANKKIFEEMIVANPVIRKIHPSDFVKEIEYLFDETLPDELDYKKHGNNLVSFNQGYQLYRNLLPSDKLLLERSMQSPQVNSSYGTTTNRESPSVGIGINVSNVPDVKAKLARTLVALKNSNKITEFSALLQYS